MKIWIRIALAYLLALGAAQAGGAALDAFDLTANHAISGYNREHLTNVTREACAAACRDSQRIHWCRSIDYNKNTSECDLSDQRATDIGLSKYTGDPYDHYSLKPALDPLSKFVSTPKAAIAGFNTESLTNVTPQSCAAACTDASRSNWCKSFDFHKDAARCDLSDKNASEVGGLKTDYSGDPYDHYALSPATGRPNPLPGNKHVLLIGIDGLRGDAIGCPGCVATPAMSSLIAGGAFHGNVLAGGSQATNSGPGWSSVFTGFWSDQHGVPTNDPSLKLLKPHVFDQIKLAYPTATVGVVGDWFNITHNLAPNMADFKSANPAKNSQEATNTVKAWLALTHAPTAIFYYLHNVDIHAANYDPLSAHYQAKLASEDAQIQQVLDALSARPNYANEEWLVVVTSDHGGRLTGHGGQSAEERRTFLILNNNFRNPSKPAYCLGNLTASAMAQVDGATPHILGFLGLPNNSVGRKHPGCG
jgi:hypothetical protein